MCFLVPTGEARVICLRLRCVILELIDKDRYSIHSRQTRFDMQLRQLSCIDFRECVLDLLGIYVAVLFARCDAGDFVARLYSVHNLAVL